MADLCNRCGVHMDDGHVRGSVDCDKFLVSKLYAHLGEITNGVIAGQFSYCPDHGLMVRVDEDGCCISCGRDAMVYCRRAGP